MEAAERIHCELDDTRVNTAGTHHTFSIRAVMRSAYVSIRQHTTGYVSKFSTLVNAVGTDIRHIASMID